MKHLQKMCLSCYYFRPVSAVEGICRINRELAPDYPIRGLNEQCEQWQTSGQQYYIRSGWVKKQAELETKKQ